MRLVEEVLNQLPGDAFGGLQKCDRLLTSLRENTLPIPQVVSQSNIHLESIDWDVVICGGTLGILIGCALVKRGLRVALLERGILRGREQEWNISRSELEVFLELDLLSQQELVNAIATQYNPARVSFFGGTEVCVKDVLNIGVDPVYLLETLKNKFLAAGGKLFENTAFDSAVVHPNGVLVSDTFSTRLLLDAMGSFSPIVQQARQAKKPDGICLVVGSCAQGFAPNNTGDLLASFTPVLNNCQYFWEAFPARDGRTTYLFTYMDLDAQHIGLETLFAEYLRLLPEYQGVELNQLQLQRALFGFFPAYRQQLYFPWGRILPIGDSSGNQSPLSFGGFGSMVRHLKRLTLGISEALATEQLSAPALKLLQPYQPNLSVTWLFQKAMRAGVGQKLNPNQINTLLSAVFAQMQQLGEPVLKPFLQDVVQFSGLTQTLFKTALNHPLLIAQVIPQVGIVSLFDWMWHYINLGIYTVLFKLGSKLLERVKYLPAAKQYYYHRMLDKWQYGSGYDLQ
jgi:lycopene cyclase CruP